MRRYAGGGQCDLLGEGEVLGRGTVLVAQVEALREVVETLRELLALEGIESGVAATGMILDSSRNE